MIRILSLVLLTVAISFANAQPATAGPVSFNNPYRSYNISGINYGSMQWEQAHRGRATASRSGWAPRRGGFFFRR